MKESRNIVEREARGPVQTFAGRSHEIFNGVEVDAEVTVRDYWRMIRKHQWLVINITLFFTILAAAYMHFQPNVYEAQSRIQVNLEDNQSLGSSKNGSIIVSNPVNDPAYFNTQLQILTSPGLSRRVVMTLDLEHNSDFLPPQSTQGGLTWQRLWDLVIGSSEGKTGGTGVKKDVPLPGATAPAKAREELVEAKRLGPYVAFLRQGLKVEPVKENRLPVKETRLIDISFTHTEPVIAAKVVNAIAEAFVLSNLERKAETGITAGSMLQKRVVELQAQVRSGEEKLINYAKNHNLLSLDTTQNTVVDRLAGLNRQLLEAENERQMAEAAYRASQAPGAAEALAEETAQQTAAAEIKLSELRQRRAQLLVDNTEDWPEVKEVEQQIAVFERFLKETRSRATTIVTTNLETRYNQALARERALRISLKKQGGELLAQNEAAVHYRMIQQELETNKNLLNGLLQRAKENEVLMVGAQNNIHIVDYAFAPDGPVGPKRLRNMTLALVASLALGVGLALFIEHTDNTVRSIKDVEKDLSLPVLVVVPSVKGLTQRRFFPAVGHLQSGDGNNRPVLFGKADARTPLAEAYRKLRTSMLLSSSEHTPKTILITSSAPGEGKTTTAINTAVSLAQTGAHVLLIDADMRRPSLHSVFESPNDRGLSSCLSDDGSAVDPLTIIEHHEVSGLYLLTSGPMPPNPAELLGSEQMRHLIARLETAFTHIVMDSPPIASFTDGVVLSSLVDGVLLVVHGGEISREIVQQSQKALQCVGANIIGVILNNVSLPSYEYYLYDEKYYQQV
ncbi:MAG: polysaccharide biosynthesis tyrosine autokinase, partial [Acidobacteriota bacterium]|nr:polysaccharide biosynthesis tyrosine autokinase [Acidobacteriota bacterium]